jgi:hypothetical protein
LKAGKIENIHQDDQSLSWWRVSTPIMLMCGFSMPVLTCLYVIRLRGYTNFPSLRLGLVDMIRTSTHLCNQCLSPLTLWVRTPQHYLIKFVSDLRQVSGFLRILRFLLQHFNYICILLEWFIIKNRYWKLVKLKTYIKMINRYHDGGFLHQ